MTNIREVRDRDSLQQHIAAGGRPKFLCFWGHTPAGPGSVDKSCLSQWFPAGFTLESVHYPTAEHYMMAEKARLFSDSEALASILVAGSPAQAKAFGRAVRGYEDTRWHEHRFAIVVRASLGKFGQNPELLRFLLGTGERVLVEASPRDRIWGIGMGAGNPAAEQPQNWRGLNLLGFALMQARQELAGA